MKHQAAFIGERAANIERVYGQGRRQRLAEIAELYPTVLGRANLAEEAPHLAQLQVAFSTWGMPLLTEEQLDLLPALRVVFYAASSVKAFAEPLLRRGILVVSAWAANAVPVAEFALAQILLANKDYFRNTAACATPEGRRQVSREMPGNFGETVALLGAGMVGRALIGLLRAFRLRVLVWDPFLAPEEAERLGVDKAATLEEAFSRGLVVSNHLANVPATRGLLRGDLFERMRPRATFINTGRGATVDEAALAEVLRRRGDLLALLDVTDPEPPAEDSPLYALPNVRLSSHLAGSQGDEVLRMADTMIEEYEAWAAGRPLRYQVTREMLPRLG